MRQLAAILFADIVGYTALMGRDESAAIQAVKKMTKLFKQQVPVHKGQPLKYYGDGSLSIFSSASAAVECGLAIQKTLNRDMEVPLRIGIHL